jgi:hypothetical protein
MIYIAQTGIEKSLEKLGFRLKGEAMRIFGRLLGKPEESANPLVCDVCNATVKRADGYVLSTSQVAAAEAYWEYAFTHQWSYTQQIDPEGGTVGILVQQQAAQNSGWLLCETCAKLFTFDKAQARELAKRKSSSPPGRGPASVQHVALAAGNAWKKLYGKWPSSIEVVR